MGISSINRTSTGLSAASAAIPSISSPFISTQGTQLIFTLSCCSSAASIARSTLSTPAARSARSQPVMQRKRSGSSVSRLMFTAVSPALRYTSACGANSVPFVVMAISRIPGNPWICSTSHGRFFRTMGSPPVRRTFRIPSCSMIPTNRKISSSVSISSWANGVIPCGGMQYLHRRLHLSVTDILK